jgi:hypothetical protein
MSDPVERVAQWVIEARRARYSTDCRWPMTDSPCSYVGEDDKTTESCRAKFDEMRPFMGVAVPIICGERRVPTPLRHFSTAEILSLGQLLREPGGVLLVLDKL